MIEVILEGNRWTWCLISAAGRVLVTTAERYPCNVSANAAAKRYRALFWQIADGIDHRQARCI